jgi:hypothetical protein
MFVVKFKVKSHLYHIMLDDCYRVIEPDNIPRPNLPNNCFQAPCSTVYPCYPEYLTKYSDKEALDLILNKTCIVQYR